MLQGDHETMVRHCSQSMHLVAKAHLPFPWGCSPLGRQSRRVETRTEHNPSTQGFRSSNRPKAPTRNRLSRAQRPQAKKLREVWRQGLGLMRIWAGTCWCVCVCLFRSDSLKTRFGRASCLHVTWSNRVCLFLRGYPFYNPSWGTMGTAIRELSIAM